MVLLATDPGPKQAHSVIAPGGHPSKCPGFYKALQVHECVASEAPAHARAVFEPTSVYTGSPALVTTVDAPVPAGAADRKTDVISTVWRHGAQMLGHGLLAA